MPFVTASLLIILGAIFDFFDGFVARLLRVSSSIGKELDSLADLITFGLAPSLLAVEIVKNTSDTPYIHLIPLCMVLMSAYRLAKFNIDERQTSSFLGLATPSSAIICGSLAYFIQATDKSWTSIIAGSAWILPLLSIILAALLVSEIPMFSMKIKKGGKFLDTKRTVFFSVAVICLVITLVLQANWSFALLLIFLFYIVENCVFALVPNSCPDEA
jgi:CDP-diacylglycerol--serine O-phosphatidyltransferase